MASTEQKSNSIADVGPTEPAVRSATSTPDAHQVPMPMYHPMPMPMQTPLSPAVAQPPMMGPTYPGFQPYGPASAPYPAYTLPAYPMHYPRQGPVGGPYGPPVDRPISPVYGPGGRAPRRLNGRVRIAPKARINVDSDSDTETDNISIATSFRDCEGWATFSVTDPDVKTVYEAWAVDYFEDSLTSSSWKRFLGIRFGVKWRTRPDGFMHLIPLVTFDQGELADMVDTTIQQYNAKNTKKGAKSYEQDLASRMYDISQGVYNNFQRLLDDKTIETNQNPCRQREWKIVMMKEEEMAMTKEAPDHKLSFWQRLRGQEEPSTVDRYFVVIKGEEVKTSKTGWAKHDRFSNPWRKIDRRDEVQRRRQRYAGKL